jgi:hypothetical protein
MSYQAVETAITPSSAFPEVTQAPAKTLAVVEEVEEINRGLILKTELYGTEKEKKLQEYVTNAELTRKTAGAEGFKRAQNMKIEGVVAGLLLGGQSVSS